MLTFIKLGGSLITDKLKESSFRADIMGRIANEIAQVLVANPALPLVLGHGSGSFGHMAAKRYDTMAGVRTLDQWRGFTEVARAAAELNTLVTAILAKAGIALWRIQPSASAVAQDGRLIQMALEPIRAAYQNGVVPLVYGDVAIDTLRGGTIISTETIFTYLALHLPVEHILLVGEVPGVYDNDGRVIPEITPQNLDLIGKALGGSAGTDVTGGMLTKVSDMVALVAQRPGLSVRIIDGTQPDVLRQSLLGKGRFGTLIHAGV